MGYSKVFEDMIERALLDVHTAYLGKVLSVGKDKKTATIQPLGYYKQYQQTAQKKAIVSNAPVIKSAREDIKAGETVLCVCCERDISEARKGVNATVPIGHHSISDSVVVGVL